MDGPRTHDQQLGEKQTLPAVKRNREDHQSLSGMESLLYRGRLCTATLHGRSSEQGKEG